MIPRHKPLGWKRHLDGWQAGLIVLVLAGSAILLAVPRAVAPEFVPQPSLDEQALLAIEREDERLADVARATELDVLVRTVGREFRAYNLAVHRADRAAFAAKRYSVTAASRNALKLGADELRALRAYQTQEFLKELHQWELTGNASEELLALSGDFISAVRRNAWCTGERQLVMDDRVLRSLYKKRWNDIVGLRGPAFELSLDEDRIRHAFLIQHPFHNLGDARQIRTRGMLQPHILEKRRLKSVDRLAKRDPDYPALIARGVIHYKAGSFARAATAFRQYLETVPDGPHTLQTRNYLKAALDKNSESGGI